MILWMSMMIAFLYFIMALYFSNAYSKNKLAIKLLFMSFLTSFSTSIYWVINDNPTTFCKINWLSTPLQKFSLSLSMDLTFIAFASTALFVTWSMIEFSYYYMEKDPKKNAFINTLIMFLLFMLLLTASKNLFVLFMGWEGVGIMSFVLMSWWHGRSDAKSASLQAIIYNRMGDTGLIFTLTLSMLYFKTWKLKEIIFEKSFIKLPLLAKLGMVLAAVGKSAQFTLHPWLPSAMEGPTPVSALLHSSTMVVAGVFLLIRTHPMFYLSPLIPSTMVMIGSLTSLFAATAAFNQYDMKKMVAYSTTSQLGLMMFCVGLNLPWLALYHICTHAFFKALLFLCSGSIIHALNKEQDIRKMSLSGWLLPLTKATMTMGTISLAGFPFLAGFYSKDLILETAQQSKIKTLSMMAALMATLLTGAYSLRTMLFLFLKKKKGKEMSPISEDARNQGRSLIRLACGVLGAGWLLALTLFPPLPLLLPTPLKLIPLISLSLVAVLFFSSGSTWTTPWAPLLFFSSSNWYYTQVMHPKFTFSALISSIQGVLRTLDQGWTSLYGPSGGSKNAYLLTQLLRTIINARMMTYFIYSFLLSFILLSLSAFFSSS